MSRRDKTGTSLPVSRKTNIWDVLIVSINKGQLLPTGGVLVLLIIVLRIPKTDLYNGLQNFLHFTSTKPAIGWVLFVVTVIGWGLTTVRLRNTHEAEMKRCTSEKKRLQELLGGQELSSSTK